MPEPTLVYPNLYNENGEVILTSESTRFTVGNVTALAPDADPTVTIAGTAPDLTIDFGIPGSALIADPAAVVDAVEAGIGADADAQAALAAAVQQWLTFIQNGTGAVEKFFGAKMREAVSVFDYMTEVLQVKISLLTSTSADAAAISAAIDAAIAANPNGAVRFPKGYYYVNKTFQQQANVCALFGESRSHTLIFQTTANTDTFKFGPPASGTYLSNCIIGGMNIIHSSVIDASTNGAGLRFVQTNGYKAVDITVNGAYEGLTIEGGQLGRLVDINLFASAGTPKTGETALLHFRQADLGGGTYQPCYTVSVSGLYATASMNRDSCIRIASADGLTFDNTYMAFAVDSLVRVAFDRDNAYVGALSFSDTYFDCVNVVKYAISIPDDAYTSSNVFHLTVGSGCFLGNGTDYGIYCTKPEIMALSVEAKITNFDKGAINVSNGSGDSLDFQLVNSFIQNCGDASNGVVRLDSGRSLNLSGTTFVDNAGTHQVSITGTWRTGSITGCANAQTTVADLGYSGATFTSPLALSGNSSRRTAAATSWLGSTFGNVAVTDPTRLDFYSEGSATPTVSFDGVSTGITYSRQILTWTRIGDRVFYNGRVTLTSKGSAGSGTLRIGAGSFPASSADANLGYPSEVRMTSVTSGIGDTHLVGDLVGGTAAAFVYWRAFRISGGVAVGLQFADVTDTTDVIFNGSYRVG